MRDIDTNDNNHIYITRGNNLVFDIKKMISDTEFYKFKPTDTVKFGIYEKERLDKPAVLLKEFEAVEESTAFRISVTAEEMKIGELKNEKTDYWYEIELNGQETLVGYDMYEDEETGKRKKKPAVLTLLPEGSGTK